MTAATIQQRVAAAHDFHGLRGLTTLPLAAYLLMKAWLPEQSWLPLVVLVAGTALARRHHTDLYGIVEPDRNSRAEVAVTLGVIALVVVLVRTLPPTTHGITWLPLLVAAMTGAAWWWMLRHVGLTWVHGVAVFTIGAVSLLPIHYAQMRPWGGTILGTTLAVVAIHDHLRLVRIIATGGAR